MTRFSSVGASLIGLKVEDFSSVVFVSLSGDVVVSSKETFGVTSVVRTVGRGFSKIAVVVVVAKVSVDLTLVAVVVGMVVSFGSVAWKVEV